MAHRRALLRLLGRWAASGTAAVPAHPACVLACVPGAPPAPARLARGFCAPPPGSHAPPPPAVAPQASYRRFMGKEQAAGTPRRWRAWHYGALAAAAGTGGVYLTHIDAVPITGRRRCVMMSRVAEVNMGRQVFAEVLNDAAAKHTLLPSSHPDVRRVKHVAKRIVSGAKNLKLIERRDKSKKLDAKAKSDEDKQHRWRVAVIQSPEPNAFALPGNHIVVTTALISLYRRSDDELAAVLGHEVAHVVCRHGAEKATRSGLVGAAVLMTSVLLGDFLLALVLGQSASLGINLPFSREMEREADRIGMQIAAAACFDPSEALAAHRRLHDATTTAVLVGEGSNQRAVSIEPPSAISTHPSYEERIKLLREHMSEARAEYARRDCDDKRTRLFARRRSAPSV